MASYDGQAHIEKLSIFELCEHMNNIDKCKAFLHSKNLLQSMMDCIKCQKPMKLVAKLVRVCRDIEAWSCSKCNTTASIRNNSIFQVNSINSIKLC